MPNLEPLRAKLKFDLSEADAAVAKAALLGQALERELGGTRGRNVDSSLKSIGTSIEDAGRKMENAGTAFVKWGKDGEAASLRISSSTARSKADFDELARRAKALGDSLDSEFKRGSNAVIKLGDDGSAALGNVSRQMSATGTAGTQAAGGLFSMGTAGLVLVGVGVALAAALAPVVAVVTGFAVGLTAAVSVMALAAGAVGALAAGVVVLAAATQGWVGVTQTVPQAQQAVANATNAHTAAVLALHQQETAYNATTTHTAQQTLALQQARQKVTDTTAALTKAQEDLTKAQVAGDNPLQKLRDDAEQMAKTLGEQAAPMAALLLGWIDKLIPSVTTLGQRLLTWFGERLPGILKGASDVWDQLAGAIDGLGTVLGRFLDEAGKRSPQLTALFGIMLGVGIDAIDGLLKNLLRLSDWFLERLPKFEPIIGQIFGGLGSTVQAIGTAFGKFVDWVIANWPAIVFTLDQTWKHFVEGYNLIKPLLDNFHKDMLELQPLFTFIETHAGVLAPLLSALGFAFGLATAAIGALVVIGVIVVAILVGLGVAINALVSQIQKQMPEAGAQFDALGRAANQMGKDIGGIFNRMGIDGNTLSTNIKTMVRQGGEQFSALGTAAHTMERDIGGAFSAIGTWLTWVGGNIRTMVRQGGDQFSALGTAANTMQRDIGRAFSAIGSAAHDMAGAVGSAFSGLGSSVQAGLKAVGGVFNTFGTAVNNALGIFKVHIDTVHYAQGGVVPGYAPGIDSVPAMLSPGEGILTPSTTRNMGGAAGIEALNRSGGLGGLGANLGAISGAIGAIGGQCVEFLQNLLGLSFRGDAHSWVNAPYAHTQTPAPGELAVFTGGPYGHLAMITKVLSDYAWEVLDSNWVAPLTIGQHVMNKGMFGFSTFLQPGLAGIGNVLAGIPGVAFLGDLIKGLLGPLVAAAKSATNAIPEQWARPLASGLIDKVVGNIEGRASGGPVLPGHLYRVGEGGPELFSPGVPGQIMAGAGGINVQVSGGYFSSRELAQQLARDIARELHWQSLTRGN